MLMFYLFLYSSERGYLSVSMDPGHPQPISRQSMAYFNPAIHLLQPMRGPICSISCSFDRTMYPIPCPFKPTRALIEVTMANLQLCLSGGK